MLSSTEAFGVPELLETILENAEPQDLLLWQRVNKTWQATIQRSPRIQEKLFFKVKPCENDDDEERAVMNPFINLFLVHGSSSCSAWPHYTDCGDWVVADAAFGGKASYPTASWRQMAISTPTVTELELHRTAGHARGTAFEHIWSVTCESGIAVGQLAKRHEEVSSAIFENYHDDENREPIWVSGLCIRSLKRSTVAHHDLSSGFGQP